MYNMKVYRYNGTYQIRIYDSPVFRKGEIDLGDDDVDPDDLEQMSDEERKAHSINVSVNRTKNSIYAIARANAWVLFCTWTYDPAKVNRGHYGTISVKIRQWLNRMKKKYCPDLMYILVPELHDDGKNWHVHGLLAGVEGLPLVDSGIVQKGRKIYNFPDWKYGWSYASYVASQERVSSYICKYITKDLCTLTQHRRRYWASQNCQRMEDVSEEFTLEKQRLFFETFGSNIDYLKGLKTPRGLIKYIEVDGQDFERLFW